MDDKNPFEQRYDWIRDEDIPESGYSTYSENSVLSPRSLTIEDIQEALRKVEEAMPKPPFAAILISKNWPRHISKIYDYGGKSYLIMNNRDMEDEFRILEARGLLRRDNVDKYIIEGTLGSIAGIPIIEDEELIFRIAVEEIRKILMDARQKSSWDGV